MTGAGACLRERRGDVVEGRPAVFFLAVRGSDFADDIRHLRRDYRVLSSARRKLSAIRSFRAETQGEIWRGEKIYSGC
ncbi:Hypothetical predicted protein [Pelobates cultripes]|uniref:Uncharacterized protein n=1 Tax=Pelobates cultripes TaxID=61616 RepID=A0AAD1W4X6_PELCU|nr:Hypothetical predicted protein [Pelobates cultripes]